MIELKNITKWYGNVLALDDLNLQIKEGEFFGFIGPNGAGKTTTIKIIAGLLDPDQGCVLINGIDIQRDPIEAKKLIGFIPDNPYLYEKLTAREYLRFIGQIFSMNESLIKERTGFLLDLFSLTRWGNELIESFSHGMRQKTVMAGALIHGPRIIIIDEPMVGLDPKGINLVKEIFVRLVQNDGVSIFMSTHTLAIAEEICTRIGIIHKGKLIADGHPQQLKELSKSENKNLEDIFLILTEEVSTTELEFKKTSLP